MAVLRSSEERDAKGNPFRFNPSLTFIQDATIRKIRGRNDYDIIDNPLAHQPITAQVQEGKLYFFRGRCETVNDRRAAVPLTLDEVPGYIVAMLKKNPLRYRESRPIVQEVKIVTLEDGSEATQVTELEVKGGSVTVSAVAPDLTIRGSKALVASESASA